MKSTKGLRGTGEEAEQKTPAISQTDIEAIFVGDVHLSLKPPVARSNEEDWLRAMRRPLKQIQDIQTTNPQSVIVYCGDIFDKWNACPEIVNWAIRNLPRGYAIAGNHDLPWHDYNEIKKSAYWTLVESGTLIDLKPDEPVGVGKIQLWGWPYSCPVHPPINSNSLCLQIAVIHDYIWMGKFGHHKAPEDKHLDKHKEGLKGYHAAFYGDNHIGFRKGNTVNCGAILKRKMDEVEYVPRIWLLKEDGSIVSHALDCSKDIFLSPTNPDNKKEGLELGKFIDELSSLADAAVDFGEAVRKGVGGIHPDIKQIILEAMGEGK